MTSQLMILNTLYLMIIGVGGIHTPEDALEKLDAGAALVQLYTGFVYEGPAAVRNINRALLKRRSWTHAHFDGTKWLKPSFIFFYT